MVKERRIYGSHYRPNSKNKAKDRRGSHDFQTGKYKRQWDRTAANRLRRQQRALQQRRSFDIIRLCRLNYPSWSALATSA